MVIRIRTTGHRFTSGRHSTGITAIAFIIRALTGTIGIGAEISPVLSKADGCVRQPYFFGELEPVGVDVAVTPGDVP